MAEGDWGMFKFDENFDKIGFQSMMLNLLNYLFWCCYYDGYSNEFISFHQKIIQKKGGPERGTIIDICLYRIFTQNRVLGKLKL